MRVIIAGSRTITDYNVVEKAIKASGFDITQVISGHALGVDMLGEMYAAKHKIPFVRYPAQWRVNGRVDKGAGKKRNRKMLAVADALIAIWDTTSTGTAHMIAIAKQKGIPIFLAIAKETSTNGVNRMTMPAIKFNHRYRKLLLPDGSIPKKLKLLEVLPINLADLSEEFLAYDTDNGLYNLPKQAAYLILIFLKMPLAAMLTDLTSFDVLTTLRRDTPGHGKLVYYRKRIGEVFDVEFIEEIKIERA